MSWCGWLILCGLLLYGTGIPDARGGLAWSQKESGPARAPVLAIDASQREAVRAAAAAYRGSAVSISLHRPSMSDRTFARDLATALRAAGLAVSMREDDTLAGVDCPDKRGLRVLYGAVRSGAVNAIAEALIRTRVLSDSLTGCRASRDEELTFIVSSGSP
jgi:hypothetical protein